MSYRGLVLGLGVMFSLVLGCGGDHAVPRRASAMAPVGAGGQVKLGEGIVGGDSVKPEDAVARATVKLLMPSGWAFCSGTLISPRHVLTAAHCLASYQESSLEVGFGPSSERVLRLKAASMVVHQGFDRDALAELHPLHAPNDLALVTLEGDAPVGFRPVPMLLPEAPLELGEELTLAGYGLTHADGSISGTLHKVKTKLLAVDPVAHEIDFGGVAGHSSCLGDSGGPAFVKRGGHLALLGVTSRGPVGCVGSGIYTDVRSFRSWIEQAEGASGAALSS